MYDIGGGGLGGGAGGVLLSCSWFVFKEPDILNKFRDIILLLFDETGGSLLKDNTCPLLPSLSMLSMSV